jgi:hypothetical protein
MFTKDELLMGRDKLFPEDYTPQISDNADDLLEAVNKFFADWTGPKLKVNSGFRPPSINGMTPHAAKQSKHQICLAVDINDEKGEVFKYVLNNLNLATALNLYFEDPKWTRTKTGGWCHIQLGAPASRHRIFIPSQALPADPNFWTGVYPTKFDK